MLVTLCILAYILIGCGCARLDRILDPGERFPMIDKVEALSTLFVWPMWVVATIFYYLIRPVLNIILYPIYRLAGIK